MLELIMVMSAVLGKYSDLAVVSALLVIMHINTKNSEDPMAGEQSRTGNKRSGRPGKHTAANKGSGHASAMSSSPTTAARRLPVSTPRLLCQQHCEPCC
jgi:hypothetical protein